MVGNLFSIDMYVTYNCSFVILVAQTELTFRKAVFMFTKGKQSCHVTENYWDSPCFSLLFHRCIRDFLSDKLAALWKVHGSQEAVSSNDTWFFAAPCISMCFIVVTIKQGLTLLILAADELSVSGSFLPDKFPDSSVEHNLFWQDGNRSYFLHITELTVSHIHKYTVTTRKVGNRLNLCIELSQE